MEDLLLKLTELNEAYGRLDEEYNLFRSNWEWFVSENSSKNPVYNILEKVEQN
ncbi:MAG: hypothetical protein L5656_02995 [Thermanaeromonas sp.]|uniref:hypothetical protein n=1 Tax=Thermanaeromonas sp. TaxID=2003697 RepID=UPI00243B8B06|nr:hypothetical protein [Thermanaeromonas sp.]MCG0277485.1 hypothetical protein [Thermanaeromonas sp.]